jgi:hypothetical protein
LQTVHDPSGYRFHGGSWSAWHSTAPWNPGFTIAPAKAGARITVEVKATDVAGRTHAPVFAVVTANRPRWTSEGQDPGGECGEVAI